MSSDEPTVDDPTRVERIASEPMATRDDLVLAAIPLSLLGGALCAFSVGLGLRTGMTLGSVVSLFALGYAIFGNPPIERGGGRQAG